MKKTKLQVQYQLTAGMNFAGLLLVGRPRIKALSALIVVLLHCAVHLYFVGLMKQMCFVIAFQLSLGLLEVYGELYLKRASDVSEFGTRKGTSEFLHTSATQLVLGYILLPQSARGLDRFSSGPRNAVLQIKVRS